MKLCQCNLEFHLYTSVSCTIRLGAEHTLFISKGKIYFFIISEISNITIVAHKIPWEMQFQLRIWTKKTAVSSQNVSGSQGIITGYFLLVSFSSSSSVALLCLVSSPNLFFPLNLFKWILYYSTSILKI